MKIQSIQGQNSTNKEVFSQRQNTSFQALKVSRLAKKSLKKTKIDATKLLESVPFLKEMSKNHNIKIKREGEAEKFLSKSSCLAGLLGGGTIGALGAGLFLCPFMGNIGLAIGIPVGIISVFLWAKNLDAPITNKLGINITRAETQKDKKDLLSGKVITLSNPEDIKANTSWALNSYMYRIAVEDPVECLEEIIDITDSTSKSIAHRIFGDDVKDIEKALFLAGKSDVFKKFALSKDDNGMYPIHDRDFDNAEYIIKHQDKETQKILLESKGKDGKPYIIKKINSTDKDLSLEFLDLGYSEDEINKFEKEAEEAYIKKLIDDNSYKTPSIHYENARSLIKVHNKLKHRPDVLAQIHSTKDHAGYYPLQAILSTHFRGFTRQDTIDDIEFAIKSFINDLKDYPDVIKTVIMAPKPKGNSIFEDYSKYPRIKEAFDEIFNEKELKSFDNARTQYKEEQKKIEIAEKIKDYIPKNDRLSLFDNNKKEKVMQDFAEFSSETIHKILSTITKDELSFASKYSSKLDMFEINKKFTNSPKELTEIYTLGKLPLIEVLVESNAIVDVADFIERISSSPEALTTTKKTLKELATKDIKNKKGLEYVNKLVDKHFTQRLDRICERKFYTAEDFMEVLSNPLVEKTGGEILNAQSYKIGGSLLMRFPDILPNEKNEKIYNEILSRLKKLPNLNYDQKDMLGISFLEKIMNSENEKLFDFVKHKTFTYSPELDLVLNNITNDDFKEKVLMETKMEFPDIEEACRLASIKAFKALLPQFNSPFYNKNFHGVKLFNEIFETYSRTSAQKVIENFGEYLPDYATEKAIEMPNRTRNKWINETE